MPPPTLVMQTTYSELLDRCAATAFTDAFPDDGVFTSKTIKGRRYWYFQTSSNGGRAQKYVGPETPELLERIAHHKQARDDERERRALVSTLVRSFGLPRPLPEIGNVIEALARAGVFRLRGVLVGTAAYQAYAAILGVRLPISSLQTNDVDIAQHANVSIAVEDRTPPPIDILNKVDESFRPVPRIKGARVTSYMAKSGVRVDFLTPNKGADTDEPRLLPAFQTAAQPLRFLDYLIHEPQPAVLLHNAGIHVLVPTPERYAIHKLIIALRRHAGAAKRGKDVQQAESLLDALVKARAFELKSAWQEALGRGRKWRDLLIEGMAQLAPRVRDAVLKTLGVPRATIPQLDLTFNNPPPHYDFSRDLVSFAGEAAGRAVQCAISREALDDHFGPDGRSNAERVEKFLENRSFIEQLARAKYLSWPVEEPEAVLVKTMDVPRLREEIRRPISKSTAKRSVK